MSETQRRNRRRKPDYFRISVFLIGGLTILICIIIIVVIFTQQLKKSNHNEKESVSQDMIYADKYMQDVSNEKETVEKAEEYESLIEDSSAQIMQESVLQEDNLSQEIYSESESVLSETEEMQSTDWLLVQVGSVMNETQIDYAHLENYFVAYEIPENIYNQINGKSYRENPDVSLDSLRYMKVLHYNFNHEIQVGELIVAAELQSDFLNIFKELFEAEYEIQSMYLVDNYWTGDPTSTDSASIDENNSSAFLYRPATGSSKLSKHAYGRAIDINPQQNPYVSYTSGSPVWSHENANDYIDRNTGLPHVITHEDACYKIFTKYGFTWGGDWNNIKDYQHFQK